MNIDCCRKCIRDDYKERIDPKWKSSSGVDWMTDDEVFAAIITNTDKSGRRLACPDSNCALRFPDFNEVPKDCHYYLEQTLTLQK